jgi:hypothetical protein
MRNRAKPNVYYKEESTVYCKVQCRTCGSNHELLEVNLSCINDNGKIESFDSILCKSCYEDLPSLEDEPEPEPEDDYPLDMTYNELAKWRNS